MYIIFLLLYLLVALSLVLLIMLQHGKGIDMGSNVFGVYSSLRYIGRDSVNIMTRLITILGILFFFLSLLLGNLNNKYIKKDQINTYSKSKELNNIKEHDLKNIVE